MIWSLQEVCPTSTQCFHCRRCSSHDDTGKETNSSSSSSSAQDHHHIYCMWLWSGNCELPSLCAVVGFDVDFLSFHSSSNSSSNFLLEYYPISWPTVLVPLPSLVLVLVFCFWEMQTESQHADFVASGNSWSRNSLCRSCYFWKMWQKLNYADLTTSGKCNRNLVCRSCYLWWKMQQNSSVCIFLLCLEMAMNSWFWEIRDLILQRVLGFTSLDANWVRKVKQHKRTYRANQTVEILLTIVDVLDHSLLRFPKDHDASWIWVVLIFRWGGEGDDGVGDDFSVWWVCNWVWYEPLVVGWNWMFWVFYEPSVFCKGWRSSIYTQIW